jgi:hypothetical protein
MPTVLPVIKLTDIMSDRKGKDASPEQQNPKRDVSLKT